MWYYNSITLQVKFKSKLFLDINNITKKKKKEGEKYMVLTFVLYPLSEVCDS